MVDGIFNLNYPSPPRLALVPSGWYGHRRTAPGSCSASRFWLPVVRINGGRSVVEALTATMRTAPLTCALPPNSDPTKTDQSLKWIAYSYPCGVILCTHCSLGYAQPLLHTTIKLAQPQRRVCLVHLDLRTLRALVSPVVRDVQKGPPFLCSTPLQI